jgi:PadR family transcriptional regulator, regulatory protein PadR
MGTDDIPNGLKGEILPGTLEMLILKTLAGDIRLNGADIAASIHRVSEGALNVKEGALYPALHRLKKNGFVECEPGLSRTNRRAKFYRMTTSGMKEFEGQEARWMQNTSAISKIIQSA